MRFEFASSGRLVFGPGTIGEVGKAASAMGSRAFIVRGSDPERCAPLRVSLAAAGIPTVEYCLKGEPTFEFAREAVAAARCASCDLVLGFGGGSAMDAAKAVAALLANPGDPLDYAEVIGAGRPLANPSLPCIAIPTTAGTGSEATKNAVLLSVEHRVKVSLRSPHMFPSLAIVDPELTRSLPPAVTATTGMDALTQLIEPFVSIRANPITDALCREGIGKAARSLARAFRDGSDMAAREDMSLASLFGGICLANSGLGAVHGLAAPLGGMIGAPHGAICAALLPHVVAVNIEALRKREGGNPALERYSELARILLGWNCGPEYAVSAIAQIAAALQVKGLASYGLARSDYPELIAQAAASSSMKGNPIVLTRDEIASILDRAL